MARDPQGLSALLDGAGLFLRLVAQGFAGAHQPHAGYPDSKCGGRILPTSEDYWRRADEARLLARQTKDLWEREALLRMAAQWERLAAHKANMEARKPR
jgi:hypothetical protein